jgi:hypothetical protein
MADVIQRMILQLTISHLTADSETGHIFEIFVNSQLPYFTFYNTIFTAKMCSLYINTRNDKKVDNARVSPY